MFMSHELGSYFRAYSFHLAVLATFITIFYFTTFNSGVVNTLANNSI